MPNYTLTITPDQAGQRLDKLVADTYGELSRSWVQKHGRFSLEGKAQPYKTKAQEGEVWTIEVEDGFDPKSLLERWDHPLEILQETDHWVAINKPEGISVHPSRSEGSRHTIVNALLAHYGPEKLSTVEEEIDGLMIPRLGIVHRLDKPTSGVLLVAKDNATHAALQAHWDQVEKIYYAVVEGQPPQRGHIEGAIIRDPHDKVRMTVSRDIRAKDAQTSFEVVEQITDNPAKDGAGRYQLSEEKVFTLLRVQIHTGRTHQIRVHLSSIGFPILGDPIYGQTPHKRMMLHAETLRFPDPQGSGKKIEVISPVPHDFVIKNQ